MLIKYRIYNINSQRLDSWWSIMQLLLTLHEITSLQGLGHSNFTLISEMVFFTTIPTYDRIQWLASQYWSPQYNKDEPIFCKKFVNTKWEFKWFLTQHMIEISPLGMIFSTTNKKHSKVWVDKKELTKASFVL